MQTGFVPEKETTVREKEILTNLLLSPPKGDGAKISSLNQLASDIKYGPTLHGCISLMNVYGFYGDQFMSLWSQEKAVHFSQNYARVGPKGFLSVKTGKKKKQANLQGQG